MSLTEKEIALTIGMIKSYWPDYQVTKENLKRPTYEFVLKFYADCINNLEEKVSFLNNNESEWEHTDLLNEERIFIKLSQLPFPAEFMLGDIYKPTAIRTKGFMKVLIHMLIYTETIVTDTLTITKEIRTCQEDFKNCATEKERVLESISVNAQKLAYLKEESRLLSDEHKTISKKYKEIQEKKKAAEKIESDKRKEIDNLKRRLENEKQEMERLEELEDNLKQEVVTDDSFTHMKHTLCCLTEEEQKLQSYDSEGGDNLGDQNNIIQHMQDCIRVLKSIEISSSINALQEVEELLKNEEQGLKSASVKLTELKNSGHDLKILDDELSKKLVELEEQNNTLKSDLQKSLNQMERDVAEIGEGYKKKIIANNMTICKYEDHVVKLRSDLKRMKKHCYDKYMCIKPKTDELTEDFTKFLLLLKEKADLLNDE